MNENPDPDARLHDHVVQLFRGHARMLADQRRNAAFFAALRQEVKPGSEVLDIGTGTGLWAIAAAKLGARKVVAIERDPLLLGLIKNLVAENGVADRIQVVPGESRQLQMAASFDLVISETIGNLGFDEDIWPILSDARQRFLKPGGKLIPASLSLRAAPAHFESAEDNLPKGVPLNYAPFESLYLNIPAPCPERRNLRLLGAAATLAEVDFRTATQPPDLQNMTASWPMSDLAEVNCCAVWPESVLAEGVTLTAMETSSWSPVIYPFRPFTIPSGELDFRLKFTAQTNHWSVQARQGQTKQEQSYSPASVTAALLGQMNFAPALEKL